MKLLGTMGLAACTLLAHGQALAFDRSVFDNLDYGIYWYSNNTASIKATGGTNPNFNPSKPTVIYVHGWQKDTVAKLYREDFKHQGLSGNPTDETIAWKNAGYNVGIFYWNQFSDEGEVRDAQAKVWDANGGQYKMRWRKSDGSYPTSPVITESASQLFYNEYVKAMTGYTGNNIRIAGHSLGNQMAIAVTEKLSDAAVAGKIPAGLVPKRVALLDPAYLKADAKWLGGKWAGELARTAVTKLKARGIIFETLRSSAASNSFGVIGDANEGLLKMTAFRELKPWYFNATQIPEKHGAAVWSYFWEFAYSPATVVGGGTAPSSSATDAATKTMMNSTKKYQHDQGAYTKTPADDTYKSVTK